MRTSQFINAALLLLLMCVTSGCNLLGFAANGLAGDQKKPAAYAPAKTPLVVIAECFDNPATSSLDAEPLARYISEDLTAHEVAPVIDPERIHQISDADHQKFHGMSIAALGRAVGAHQILYVNIVSTSVNFADNSDMIRGSGEIRVRLIDANTGATLWPVDLADGYAISADTKIFRRSERNEISIRSDLHRSLAVRAASLFYPTKTE